MVSGNKIYLLGWLLFFSCQLSLFAQSDSTYSFIVAGHAYGSHDGNNLGLHPLFLYRLNYGFFDNTTAFFVFTGDIVKLSNEDSW